MNSYSTYRKKKKVAIKLIKMYNINVLLKQIKVKGIHDHQIKGCLTKANKVKRNSGSSNKKGDLK
jgi:hypothetical protein